MHAILIASESAPPGVPVWAWALLISIAGAVGIIVGHMLPAWIRETAKGHAPKSDPPKHDPFEALRNQIDGGFDRIHARIDVLDKRTYDIHGRVGRIEGSVNPDAPAIEDEPEPEPQRKRGNTGAHSAVSAVQLAARKT